MLTPPSQAITFEDLTRMVSPHHPLDVAATALRAALDIPPMEFVSPMGLSAHHYGALLLAGFNRESWEDRDPGELPSLPPDLAANLLLASAGLVSERYQAERLASGGPSPETMELLMLRIICLQSGLQEHPFHGIARAAHLLELDDCEPGATLRDSSPYDDLFDEAYGCTARDYVGVLLAAWAAAGESFALDVRNFLEHSPRREHLRPILERVLGALACDSTDIAPTIRGRFAEYDADGLVHAFFGAYPLVRLDACRYLMAPRPFLRFHSVDGVLFRALELAIARERRRGGANPGITDVSTRMGKRFECLVGHVLSDTGRVDEVEEEHRYISGQNDLSPDFLVFAPDGSVVFLQAKLKRIQAGAFFGYDLDAVASDCRGALAEMVWKTVRYLHRLHTMPPERFTDEGRRIRERVLGANRWFLLGVGASLPPFLKIDAFRRYVEEGVAAKLRPEEYAWLQSRAAYAGWHIIDLGELSAFAVTHQGGTMAEALGSYLGQDGFGRFLDRRGHMMSFADWVIARHPGGAHALPRLKAAGDRIWDWVIDEFWGGTGVRGD